MNELTAGNQDKATESEDEGDGETLLELHLELHDHSDRQTDNDEIGEDVEQDRNPVVDSRSLGATLVTRVLGPSLVVRVALKQNIEEDCGVCDSETSQGNVVGDLHLRAGCGEFLVEQHKGKLDRPERRDVEDRTRNNHFHDADKLFFCRFSNVTQAKIPPRFC